MRDKILKLMSMTISPLDQTAEAYVNEYRRAFEGGFGEVPEEASRALDCIADALKTAQGGVLDKLVETYAKYFTEEDLDAHIAWCESAANKRSETFASTLRGDIAEILNDWKADATKSREAQLQELLGMGQVAPPGEMVETPPTA